MNIEKLTSNNKSAKKIIYVDNNMELAVESVEPYQKVLKEVHPRSTQFIRVESGSGYIEINGRIIKLDILNNDAVIVPANTLHEITARKNGLKFYTIYSPPLNFNLF